MRARFGGLTRTMGMITIALSLRSVAAEPGKGMTFERYVPNDAVRKAYPGICDYLQGFNQREALRARDYATLASALYGLNDKEAHRISSLHEKHTNKTLKSGGDTYAGLINKRARYFRSVLLRAQKSNEDWNDVFLHDDGLAKITAEIESARPDNEMNFRAVQDIVEGMIDDERIAVAREEWVKRLGQASGQLHLRGVLMEAAEAGGVYDEALMHELTAEREKTSASRKLEAVSIEKKAAKPTKEMKPVHPKLKSKPPTKKPKQVKSEKATKAAVEKKPVSRQATKRTTPATAKTKGNPPVAPVQVPSAPPLNEWEKYVRDFIDQHKLSESQTHSALGILEELQTRAEGIRARRATQRKRAEAIQDRKVRAAKLADLDRPIDRLFVNLKSRLDQLLTTQQRAALKTDSKAAKSRGK